MRRIASPTYRFRGLLSLIEAPDGVLGTDFNRRLHTLDARNASFARPPPELRRLRVAMAARLGPLDRFVLGSDHDLNVEGGLYVSPCGTGPGMRPAEVARLR